MTPIFVINPKDDVATVWRMMSLRERNRLFTMRTTQRAALDMFEERGFETVTVAEIAEHVGMAASTLYRHFSTKEAIVLWDEHDPALDTAFEREFRRRTPFDAIRTVFVEELGRRYDDDLDFQLRRVQFIFRSAAIHAAAIETDIGETAELTDALAVILSPANRSAAPIMAGAAMVALDDALDRWQRSGAARPLGDEIAESFDHLSALASLT